MFYSDVVICIPTKRPPPILTLENHVTGAYPVIVVADPAVEAAHREWYGGPKSVLNRLGQRPVQVVRGAVGMCPQVAECYRVAARAGFPWFFRVDDDLSRKTFVHAWMRHVEMVEALRVVRACVESTKTTLAGFCNTSRRDYLSTSKGFHRSYGLIHGGAQIACSALDPSPFIDETLVRFEDVYRTCAHRKRDGAVGRVSSIGFDKRDSSNEKGGSRTSVVETDEARTRAICTILNRFPGMVSCNGTRKIHGGTVEIPNWRMLRDKSFRP